MHARISCHKQSKTFGLQILLCLNLNWNNIIAALNKKIDFSARIVGRPIIDRQLGIILQLLHDVLLGECTLEACKQDIATYQALSWQVAHSPH